MDLGTLIAVFLTLCIFSFLYKDNPFYKFAEHLLVGISVGYVLVIALNTTLMPKLINPVFKQGEFVYIIPGILGLFMLLRFIPRYAWLSRISIALIIGAGAGVAIPATIQARLFSQMQASMTDFASIDGIIIFLGIATTLAVALHEIPQEFGDFGALVYGGFGKKRALAFNYISAITAIVGGVIGYFAASVMQTSIVYLLPFAAGNFIYIAAADLIPEIKHAVNIRRSILHFCVFLAGIGVMFLVKFMH